MDSQTIFTKTAKGLMEATGKTSALSRDLRALLREIDGKATVAEVQARFDRMSEAKLLEALQGLANDDYVREFTRSVQTPARPPRSAAPPPRTSSTESEGEDLDFTAAIPPASTTAKLAEEAARQKAQERAAAEAAARARAEVEARAKAAAEAAARAKAEAAARAKAEAEARARIAAEAAAKAKAEAEAKARAEAAARAKAEAEARAKREAQERARREAEEKARKEAEARAKAEEQARIEAEARARKEAEERARVEAELKAKLEEERRAREEAERRAREQAERERKEAEEKARREADELRAKLEEERKAREEAERRAREQAERERKEAEEKARREADELRAKLEEERKAREDAERRAKEDAERMAREAAERERQQAEENARREAEVQARREAEERAGAQEQARSESETRARRDAEEAERKAKEASERERRETEEAERKAKEASERERRETEEAERKAKEASERERREAEEKAARAAAEQARAQAAVESGPTLDDLVKIETDFDALAGAAAPVKAEAERPRDSADDRMLRAVEEQARREAEEKARSAAEEKARKEADAAAKRAEEEAGRKGEQEERRPKEGELPATREQQLAEAQALMQAQDAETERHFADMEKELEAEQAAAKVVEKIKPPEESPRDERKREKEERKRDKEERKRDKEETREHVRAAAAARALEAEAVVERAPAAYRTPINWGKPVALGLFLLLLLGLVLVHFVSFDGSIPQFEKLAAAHLQQPVKIKALHLSLVPQPHWRLDGVSVGNEGQLAVPRVKATAELGSMFSDKKVFKSIELESPVLSEQGLVALLFGRSQGQDFKVASVIVKNGKLDSKTIILPALDAKIALGEDGAWRQIALETPDHKTSLMLKPEGEGAELEVETNAFSLPFDPSFILENFTAKGVIRRGELRLSELKGGIYGGFLSGNASLKWGADWSLGGEVSVRVMDPARFAPALFEEGKLEGKAAYAMRAKSYDELFAAPRLEGSFEIQKGALLGVELGRLLQGGGVGGKTSFAALTGSFVREAGKTQVRQIHLVSGPVSAAGTVDADGAKRINGHFTVELKSPVAQARANLVLSGTLREPRFSR